MPPKAANTARRKGPAFKPPRPVEPAVAATKPASNAVASRSTGGTNPSRAQAATIISSDDEPVDEDFGDLPSDPDELMDLDPEISPPKEVANTITPPIPAPLLARLLHHNFDDKNTQIQKGAMDLFGKYLNIFVQEALARAKEERRKARSQGHASGRFLQVEDLEKTAVHLVLDF